MSLLFVVDRTRSLIILRRTATRFRPGAYIVQFKDDVDISEVPGRARAMAMKADKVPSHVFSNSIKGFSIQGVGAGLKKMFQEDAGVLRVEPDRVVSVEKRNDKKPPGGGEDVVCTPQEKPYGIERVGGGGQTFQGNGVAWVIDSRIDLDHHPDLTVDASRGFSAFTKGKDAGMDDGDGHGTHVAGTIAARIDDKCGVVGVVPGATVVPVKVLNSHGSGSYSGVIAGVDHVAANGKPGDVANMSLGGPPSDAVDKAVENAAGKGIKFTLAAGNEGDDASNSSPARAKGDNIYTISAMDSNDNFASWSNYGSPVDYCAPGVAIRSTWKDGGYNTISGTSMAAPHAAGVLLLGEPNASGYVKNDKDGNRDPIIHT